MGLLDNKRALIVGMASDRSIAYGIAEAFHREGAELALGYQTERFKGRVEKMAANWNNAPCFQCDVSSDEEITTMFNDLSKVWDGVDIIIHSVAYAPADQLGGDYMDSVSREGFQVAHDISSYSFAALAKAAMPYMEGRDGSLLTMSYLGAERAMPNYNVMGIAKASLEANMRFMAYSLGPRGTRVNAISAGPIRTLAASGIKGFKEMLNYNERVAPLRKNVTTSEVGNAAVFLCSDYASGITGEVLHVDAGYHFTAMGELEGV